jgi:hypothetical protein
VKKTLIIYPFDPTTSFLLESFKYLEQNFSAVTYYQVLPNEESHNKCILLIPNYTRIIFMGHGSHQKLSGSRNENYNRDYLISFREICDLTGKNWILFSCNSNELIKKCSSSIGSGIGFGDLPTDFNDIRGIREYDSNAYKNINEDIINEFKQSINWIISKSISQLFEKNLTTVELFYYIKILITYRMLEILKDPKNFNQREHSKLLYDMKHEMELSNPQ